jgi:hypothetical protein
VIASYSAQPFELPPPSGLLPRIGPGKVLSFHRGPPVVDRKGILEPVADSPEVPIGEIDVFVVPGVGFSTDGTRLGRGAGYYDATLALARPDAVKVGYTFDCCVVDSLPRDRWDVLMDWIVTESRTLQIRSPGAEARRAAVEGSRPQRGTAFATAMYASGHGPSSSVAALTPLRVNGARAR